MTLRRQQHGPVCSIFFVKLFGVFIFTALSVISLSPGAFAAMYYVATTGSDSNPGTSAAPFRTITYAYSHASAGTVIQVAPGIYADYQKNWGIHLGSNGTAALPIILRSQVRGQAIIDGRNAADRNQGIYIDGDYNVVDGFAITGGPHGGIAVYGNGNQVLRNEIHHNGNVASSSTNGQDGIYSDEGTSNNSYDQNYIHDNGRTGSNLDHGLYLCGANEKVFNNISVRNASNGLQVAGYTTRSSGVSNLKVYNNVFAGNGTNGIVLWMSLNGVSIKNNIFYQNGRYAINSWEAHGSGVEVDHNISFGNTLGNYNFTAGSSNYSYDLRSSIFKDPLFVNNASDFRLQPGSPGIDSGEKLSEVSADFTGTLRPQDAPYDIGAYEIGATTISRPRSPSNLRVSGS